MGEIYLQSGKNSKCIRKNTFNIVNKNIPCQYFWCITRAEIPLSH